MTYTLAIVISRRVAAGGKSKSSAEELRDCDDAETRLLLEVTILLPVPRLRNVEMFYEYE